MSTEEKINHGALRPRQRDHLEVIPLYDDAVLFDPNEQTGISLNKSAHQIWDLSDGSRTVSEIVSEIGRSLALPEDSEAIDDLDFDVRTTLQSFEAHNLVQMLSDARTFSNPENFPKLTEQGFEVIDLPQSAWEIIKDIYEDAKKLTPTQEDWGTKDSPSEIFSELFFLDELAEKRDRLYPLLQPIHEKWCGEKLDPAAIYGIRSYLTKSRLFQHKDRIQSHHVSSIILVDKNLSVPGFEDEYADDWGLDIQAHDGTWHKVFLQPGQAVLYESSTCSHGRDRAFEGTYYRNCFVHFKLRHWEYVE